MAYITKAEYDAARPDNGLSTSDFNIYEQAASAILDRLTLNKIPLFGGISRFSADTQQRIKNSVIFQVDTIDAQGGIDALLGFADFQYKSVKIGKYSDTKDNVETTMQQIDGVPISPMIRFFLQPTNLLNRQMNVCLDLEDFR